MSILFNLLFVVLGYLIGSINFAIIFSRKTKPNDIRDVGSGNAGATNGLRVYGKKFGALVFFLDFFKAYIPLLALGLMSIYIPWFKENKIVIQTIGLGVIIGHIFPIFHKFKGGKGVSCTVGLILSINLILFLIAAVLFFTIVFWKKIVSLAVLVITTILSGLVFVPYLIQGMPLGFLNQSAHQVWYAVGIIYFIVHMLLIFAHRENIKRLLTKSESSFTNKKRS